MCILHISRNEKYPAIAGFVFPFQFFLLALALLVITIVPAFAADSLQDLNGHGAGGANGKGINAPFTLVGTISSIDPATCTVTIVVACGNKVVKPFIGQSLTMQTNTTTRLLLRNLTGVATPITFDGLAIGQKVSVNGQFTNNAWVASRITLSSSAH